MPKSQSKNSSHTDEKLKYYAAQLNEIGNWHGHVVPSGKEAPFFHMRQIWWNINEFHAPVQSSKNPNI